MKSNSQSNPQSRHIGRLLLVALAAAGFGGLATALVLSSGQQAASAEPTIPAGANLVSWFDNGAGGRRVLQIFSGDAPAVGVRLVGTVKSDSNCDPDALGLSHCHNVIDLSNGRRIEIVNTHIMTKHPCLAPGDRVAITRLNENWVIASAAGAQRTY